MATYGLVVLYRSASAITINTMNRGVIFTFTEIFLMVSTDRDAWKQLGAFGNLPGVFYKSL
jgi:hypothetical protein